MSNVGTFLKRIMNIMRDDAGVDGTAQTLSQIVWMLFLRVYDLKEEEWELYEDNYQSPIPEECRWRKWAIGASQKDQMTGDTLSDFINNILFPSLKLIEVTPDTSRRVSIVRDMMADTNNYMKNGVCIRQAVNLINEIDFYNNEERHAFNDIYETLLKELQTAGKSGEFYTPRALTSFIVSKVKPELGMVCADFACGTGGFLVDTVKYLQPQMKSAEDLETLQKTVLGVEKKQMPYMLCTTNMLLHDIPEPNILHSNSLERNVREYRDDEKVDIVVMNPPYGGHEQSGILSNFPADLRNSETADLFVIEILYRLREYGRVGIILPDGFLFGTDNSKKSIKEKLMKECNLHTVIRMCGSVFAPYTPISTNLLFFDKTGPTQETWFYRYDLPEGYKAFSKTKPLTLEHMKCIDEWWDNRVEIMDEKEDETMTETWKAKKYSIQEIIDRDYDIDLCGFPHKEEVILPPDVLIAEYQEKRESLNDKIDKKLTELLSILGVGSE